MKTLDELLWPDNSNATLHDAELLSLTIDYVRATAEFTLSICIGDPSSDDGVIREARQPGILTVTGLEMLSIEPPTRDNSRSPHKGLLVDADLETTFIRSRVQIVDQPQDQIQFWIYVLDWNSFMRVTGKKASFRWEDLLC
ncbi:MAG: hypothetical protein HY774_15820 [Acidobacteria bacterium]|nr:hypothetical protein [Acidobacteriota bacterium]